MVCQANGGKAQMSRRGGEGTHWEVRRQPTDQAVRKKLPSLEVCKQRPTGRDAREGWCQVKQLNPTCRHGEEEQEEPGWEVRQPDTCLPISKTGLKS